MKRLLIIIALCLPLSAAANQKDTLRILAIGNSFSQDAVEQNLHEIALEDGQEMIIGNMYIGGCSLERHYSNSLSGSRDYQYRKVGADGIRHNTMGVTLEEALADEDWDIVTLQQCSPLSGFADSYEPYLSELIGFVRGRTRPDVTIMWHQTWAYATGAVHRSFPDYDMDQKKMYSMIMDASARVCGRYGIDVIPVGTAIQNLRKTFSRENCTRDGFHLNNGVGRYTAALTWYEAITGHNVEDGEYKPEVITDTLAVAARKAAHAAVMSPFEVTNVKMEVAKANYDKAAIPAYELPDALRFNDGKKVRNARQWMERRRPELYSMFEHEMFGKAPAAPADMSWEELYSDPDALGGLATRREVRIYFDKARGNYMTLLIYTPNGVQGKVPAFLGINFYGNECTYDEPGILLPDEARKKAYGIHAPHKRGFSTEAWQVETLMRRGYALATFCRDDIDPDFDDAYGNGVQPLFYREGQKFPAPDEWGTIAAWAWGLSRAMDYLETDSRVDASKVAVIGHSRLGKTALWAGASDSRFAMAISNDSGCGGAALSRRAVGETVCAINLHFPHWFCANFDKYNDNEAALPFDQHELIALMAPRPVYVASAKADLWADPEGEQMAAGEARKVYALFGKDAPEKVGSHLREGRHAITAEDWAHYLDFADRFLK